VTAVAPRKRAGARGLMQALPATRAEIDLDALRSNVAAIRGSLEPGVQLLVVVKADGYGHGAIQVGRTALEAGASHLAVYTVPEALSLRNAGIAGPVLVLGPIDPSQAEACVTAGITPAIASMQLARALSQRAVEAGMTVTYHLEVDTGLTRYGILVGEVGTFLKALKTLPGLKPEGIFTHYASADEPDPSKALTWQQFELFRALLGALEEHGFHFSLRHAAASAAMLHCPAMDLDMVRCGISVYGYYPSAHVSRRINLQPVMSLKSALARVRTFEAGTGVSYGHEFVTSRRTIIGLVPFGYADGFPRCAGKHGHVLIAGRPAKIVGRVAMDQLMVDLTDVGPVAEGDEVVILGRSGESRITADDIAGWAGSISYEVLAGIGVRVPRVYLSAGRPVAIRHGMSMKPIELSGR